MVLCIPPPCWITRANRAPIIRRLAKSVRVNLIAAMALTRAMLPLLVAAADASVILTLDRVARHLAHIGCGYAVAKAGLFAMQRYSRDEWEKRANLRVNAVVPGPIHSPRAGQRIPCDGTAPKLPNPSRSSLLYLYLFSAAAETRKRSVIIDAQRGLQVKRIDVATAETRRAPGCNAIQHALPKILSRQSCRQGRGLCVAIHAPSGRHTIVVSRDPTYESQALHLRVCWPSRVVNANPRASRTNLQRCR
jgi:hypothetical protein